MSTDSYSFEVADTTIRSYALDPNPLYEYPAASSLQPLATCPLNSEIKEVQAPWSSGSQFVFDTNFGKSQFVSNCIRFDFTVPLTITLTDTTVPDITSANYMTEVFEGGQLDLCYSQYSLLQCVNNLSIDLNSRNLMNLNNLSETFNQIAPYYKRSDVNEWFHASQPDRFNNFNDYVEESNKVINYVDHNKETVTTTVNTLNEANIFASKYQDGYTSRTPVWTFVPHEPGDNKKKICRLKASFWMYLPLTFGAVPDKATALSGINRLNVTFTMKTDMASHLFNMKFAEVGDNTYRYESIVLSADAKTGPVATMLCQVYSPPQFMRSKMMNPATGLMQPYSVSCPRIITTTGNVYRGVAAKASEQFNVNTVRSSVVPKSIYISLQRVKEGTFTKCATTPINYALITDMSFSIAGARTNFPSLRSLLHLCDTNGYDEMDPVGRLLKGAPIRLDVGKDISLPADLVVGQSYDFNFEIVGNFMNQSSDTADYKLLVTVVTDSTIDFDGDGFAIASGAVIDSSVLKSQHFLQTQYSMYQTKVNVLGGGFFTDAAKWVGRNAVKIAKSAWENREKIAKTVGDVAGLVKAVRGGSVAYSNVSGGSSVRTMGAGKVRETVFK